jgi:RNA polymerase sigma-70 factor, ECF subfamily
MERKMPTGKNARPQDVQTDPDDAQLIARFQRGEAEVFNELVLRYQDSVYRFALRYAKQHEAALDITQEVFLKAYQGLSKFQGKSQFYTWLRRIAFNHCVDENRRAAKHRAVIDTLEPDALPAIQLTPAHFPSPTARVENQELADRIRQAVSQLSPMQREVFILRYHEGLPLKTIAEKFKREIGTIKSHLFFARERLKGELQPYLSGQPSNGIR